MSVSIAESFILVLKRADDATTTGIVVADETGGLSARVDDQVVTESTSGRPSHGETENLVVAMRLIERLSMDGETWRPPVVCGSSSRTESGIDWETTSADGRILSCQNVRVRVDPDYWKSLGDLGVTTDTRTVAEAVVGIREAIEHKSAALDRGKLVLALDATRASACALPDVTAAFVKAHGQWSSSLGFEAIYIVGPNATLTTRLA